MSPYGVTRPQWVKPSSAGPMYINDSVGPSNGLPQKGIAISYPSICHQSSGLRWVKKTQALVHPDSTFLNELNSLPNSISYEWKSWKINVHHWYDFLNSTMVKIDEDLWIRVSSNSSDVCYSDLYQELGEADILGVRIRIHAGTLINTI